MKCWNLWFKILMVNRETKEQTIIFPLIVLLLISYPYLHSTAKKIQRRIIDCSASTAKSSRPNHLSHLVSCCIIFSRTSLNMESLKLRVFTYDKHWECCKNRYGLKKWREEFYLFTLQFSSNKEFDHQPYRWSNGFMPTFVKPCKSITFKTMQLPL